MLSIGVSPKRVIYRGFSPKPCYLRCLSVWGQSGAARTLWGRTVAAHGGSCAGEENAAKKQKGSKGYPKGVIETGRDTIKYQARVSYKPDGGKTVQRSAGTFNTPEEALKAVSFLYWLFRHSRRFRDEKEDGRCM